SGLQTSGVETKKLGFTKRQSAQSEPSDSHLIPPSPVVHVRGLCDAVVEADLVEVLEKFGTICYVMMMPFKRQALVEFDSLESAERCVRSGGSEPVFIANQQAFFNFSTSQRITSGEGKAASSHPGRASIQRLRYRLSLFLPP
uniref:RRM domain-containing protein n=1 Tax=Xiphophorus couchianus TaxID=32473 RepID=A0A3B5LSE3_9TELE